MYNIELPKSIALNLKKLQTRVCIFVESVMHSIFLSFTVSYFVK